MSRIEIIEIVECLEGIVEYMGEQTYDPRAKVDASYEPLWTCLRDLARYVRDTTPTSESEEDVTRTRLSNLARHVEGCATVEDPVVNEDTVDSIIQGALGSRSLGRAPFDVMRRLANEILFLRTLCRDSGIPVTRKMADKFRVDRSSS